MQWNEIIQSVNILEQGGDGNPVIGNITYDSRQVTEGTVFVAIPGLAQHGDRFINDAIARGAVALISENKQTQITVPWIQVSNPRQTMVQVAKKLWHIDFASMMMVGVTGTNGKTTTAGLFHTLFSQLKGNAASWLFSTIEYVLGDRVVDAAHTTPEGPDLLRYIGTAENKPASVTMEVSSHALALDRVEGFLFDIAVWTNLTQDHLDFHGTMESYFAAKKLLFQQHMKRDGVAVVNIDDAWGKRLADELADIPMITYGFADAADVRIIDAKTDWSRTEITIQYRNMSMTFSSKLTGFFNVYNMTAFVSGALGKGIDKASIQQSFDRGHVVPGRMERVTIPADFAVLVDYAHTPDALCNVLSTARKMTSGRLLCVFGCGGDRDKTKRPLMGKAVAEHCDEAIVTTDNPRSEAPRAILNDIILGIPLDFPHCIIADRREAIKKALSMAQKGDCVVVAGKGHETYQEIQGVRHHFDDREVVRELFKESELVSETK